MKTSPKPTSSLEIFDQRSTQRQLDARSEALFNTVSPFRAFPNTVWCGRLLVKPSHSDCLERLRLLKQRATVYKLFRIGVEVPS